MSVETTFGQWLKQRRRAIDLTQEDLADRIGCSLATVEKIEAGSRRPSRQMAELLASYLDIAPDERAAFMQYARQLPGAPNQVPSFSPPTSTRSPIRESASPAEVTLPRRRTPNNLLMPVTPLIGREEAVKAVRKRLLDSGVRLLTLTGPPGIGKTRLSLQAAEEMLDDFESGVYFVELAPIEDPAQVSLAIARTLGVRESEGRSLLDGLKHYLHDKRLLLVLDNFEQVIEAAPVVAELLKADRHLKVLVTSRVILHLYGEHDFPVPPLALPPVEVKSGKPAHAEGTKVAIDVTKQFIQYDAVRLFTERASALKSDFSLNDENARTVAEICQRLEGMPLAIELAAARIRSLSPEEISVRLENSLKLLAGGPVDLPERQRALRTAIDWSYNLLSEPERAVFGQLAVFAGGWTSEAIEAVRRVDKTTDDEDETLELLTQLVDKSLVIVDENAAQEAQTQSRSRRYRMLETIREYARTRLTDVSTFDRMVAYYTGYVESHPTDYNSLDRETPNMLAALQVAIERGLRDELVRCANAFYHFLETRGLYELAETQLRRAEEAARATGDNAGLATTLLNLGRASERRGNYAPAEGYYREGLTLARDMRNNEQTSALLQNLGGVVIRRGDYAQAETYLLEGLGIARQTGDSERVSAVLGNLGTVAFNRGDYRQAEAYYKESLDLARSIGNKERICALLQGLGAVANNLGDYAGAEVCFKEGLELAREIGHRERTSFLLMNLGAVSNTHGDYGRAEAYYVEGLELAREIGDRDRISDLLRKLGELAGVRGDNRRAEEYLLEGLDIARSLDHRERISSLLCALGTVDARYGDYAQAETYYREGLDLAHTIGHRRLIGSILCEWGELDLKRGKLGQAADAFHEALGIANEVGSQDLVATALYGLARIAAERGELSAAGEQGRESLKIFESITHNKMGEVKRWLVSVGC